MLVLLAIFAFVTMCSKVVCCKGIRQLLYVGNGLTLINHSLLNIKHVFINFPAISLNNFPHTINLQQTTLENSSQNYEQSLSECFIIEESAVVEWLASGISKPGIPSRVTTVMVECPWARHIF